ncbi:MAG: YbaB/EbfC family nucleoid-associated protein [Lawsonella clevelandensis]
MATLRKAGEDLETHSSEGSTDAVTVTISGRGCLTSVECKDKAKKLTANELATSILEAYQQAKTAEQTYSEQWSTQLTATLEEINPVRVHHLKVPHKIWQWLCNSRRLRVCL